MKKNVQGSPWQSQKVEVSQNEPVTFIVSRVDRSVSPLMLCWCFVWCELSSMMMDSLVRCSVQKLAVTEHLFQRLSSVLSSLRQSPAFIAFSGYGPGQGSELRLCQLRESRILPHWRHFRSCYSQTGMDFVFTVAQRSDTHAKGH